MKAFFILTKRKTFELGLLLILDGIFYLLWNNWDFIALFTFGYIWNWVASQASILTFESRRSRFSTLKLVINLQNLILMPLGSMPEPVKFIARTLPAGIFWSAVILFNQSYAPWWAAFIGSLALELVVLETKLFSPKPQENVL